MNSVKVEKKKRGKKPGLKRQLKEHVESLDRIGQSKRLAQQMERIRAEETRQKWNPVKTKGIYSYRTKEAVLAVGQRYIDWVQSHPKEEMPERSLEGIKKYVPQYIEERKSQGLSAWTICHEVSMLAKIYNCRGTDFGVDLPPRRREDRIQNQKKLEDFENKKHDFNMKKHADLVTFCLGTGARRGEILGTGNRQGVCSRDIWLKNGRVYVRLIGKGGKQRVVEVLREFQEDILRIAQEREGQKQLFAGRQYPQRTPGHVMRQEFAKKAYFEKKEELYSSGGKFREHYITRDGRVYDREILQYVSQQLGHNRVNVVANNYISF